MHAAGSHWSLIMGGSRQPWDVRHRVSQFLSMIQAVIPPPFVSLLPRQTWEPGVACHGRGGMSWWHVFGFAEGQCMQLHITIISLPLTLHAAGNRLYVARTCF